MEEQEVNSYLLVESTFKFIISYDLVTTISPTQCFINRIAYIFSSHQGSVNFKFGVVYAKQGQTTDDEVFSNG